MSESVDPTGFTAAERTLLGKISAHSQWARFGGDERRARTDAARAALRQKFERDVDPDGVLTAEERRRRGQHAFDAHMARLSLSAARARRIAAERAAIADESEAEIDALADRDES